MATTKSTLTKTTINEIQFGEAASPDVANRPHQNLETNVDDILSYLKNDGPGSEMDADLLDGQQGSYYQNASNLNAGSVPSAQFTDTSHGQRSGGNLHAVATDSINGFMSASDKTKLDGITDLTGTQILSRLAPVDGANSGLDADTLDGNQGSYYENASNLSAGILPSARFNDSSHGNRGGGSLHNAATSGSNGFMSSFDKSKLDGIMANANNSRMAVVVTSSGSQTIPSGANTPISWSGTFTGNNLSVWPGGQNLNVPSGVSIIRIHAAAQLTISAACEVRLNFTVNGSIYQGHCGVEFYENDPTMHPAIAIHSMDIPVNPGDTIKIVIAQTSGSNATLNDTTYECCAGMEIIA